MPILLSSIRQTLFPKQLKTCWHFMWWSIEKEIFFSGSLGSKPEGGSLGLDFWFCGLCLWHPSSACHLPVPPQNLNAVHIYQGVLNGFTNRFQVWVRLYDICDWLSKFRMKSQFWEYFFIFSVQCPLNWVNSRIKIAMLWSYLVWYIRYIQCSDCSHPQWVRLE